MKNTAVAFVVDESGSMSGKENFISNSFQEQATVLRESKGAGKITTTMVKFGSRQKDGQPFVAFQGKSPSVLSLPQYSPFGYTPLCDAVALAIQTLEKKPPSNTAFLVTVFTDGDENASREWTSRKLADLVESKQATGKWTFAFIGPSTKDVSAWGVPSGNIYTYTTVQDGMMVASSGLSTFVNVVRPFSMSTTGLMTTAVTYIR